MSTHVPAMHEVTSSGCWQHAGEPSVQEALAQRMTLMGAEQWVAVVQLLFMSPVRMTGQGERWRQ